MSVFYRERTRYFAATIGTLLFAALYECFSHQVYSLFLLLAFLFPLLGGALACTLLLKSSAWMRVDGFSRCLYRSGIATLTIGSLFQGILEIYGTTNRLSAVYWVVGACLLLAALLRCQRSRFALAKSPRRTDNSHSKNRVPHTASSYRNVSQRH